MMQKKRTKRCEQRDA